jgi:hypothetical protein
MESGSGNLVDEIMLEFGSYTCADVSLETVHIVYVPAKIALTYKLMCDMWGNFRRSPFVVEKYGDATGPMPILPDEIVSWYKNHIIPVFTKFIEMGMTVVGPYYLCACRESGDEYFIRRAMQNDPFTAGKFMTIECRFSAMDDCIPRNKLRQTRGDMEGEYLLFVTHKPGTMDDQEKLRMMLASVSDDKFALF